MSASNSQLALALLVDALAATALQEARTARVERDRFRRSVQVERRNQVLKAVGLIASVPVGVAAVAGIGFLLYSLIVGGFRWVFSSGENLFLFLLVAIPILLYLNA